MSDVRLVNPPSSLQEEILIDLLQAIYIQCPREEDPFPKCLTNMVLHGFKRPLFTESVQGPKVANWLRCLYQTMIFLLEVCIYQTGSPIPSNEFYTTSHPQANVFPRNIPMFSWRTGENPLPCLGFMPLCYNTTSGCSEQFIETVCALQTRYAFSSLGIPSLPIDIWDGSRPGSFASHRT